MVAQASDPVLRNLKQVDIYTTVMSGSDCEITLSTKCDPVPKNPKIKCKLLGTATGTPSRHCHLEVISVIWMLIKVKDLHLGDTWVLKLPKTP